MSFLLSTAFTVSHRFEYAVPLFLLHSGKSFISFVLSSLTQEWFNWKLLNLHKFVGFLQLMLLLNSNFKPWWSDKIQEVTPNFLHMLIQNSVEISIEKIHFFALLPSMWSVLEKIPRGAEKKLYSFVCVCVCLGDNLCRCLLSPFESWHLLVLLFLY